MGRGSPEDPGTLLPALALSHASPQAAHAEPGSRRPHPSRPGSAPADPRGARRNQQSHASESRAHGAPPRRGGAGGARREGAGGPGSREAPTAAASSRGDRRCGAPPRPRPPGARPAAVQSPGRWARAAQDAGSLAGSFTHHGDRGHHGGGGGCRHRLRAAGIQTRRGQVSKQRGADKTSRAPGAGGSVCDPRDVTAD